VDGENQNEQIQAARKPKSTFRDANIQSKAIFEQRIQSLATTISIVRRILEHPNNLKDFNQPPIQIMTNTHPRIFMEFG
jgi:hypothetical protein